MSRLCMSTRKSERICERCARPASDELGDLVHAWVNKWLAYWHFPCLRAERLEVERLKCK